MEITPREMETKTDNEWISVNDLLPKRGVKVRCKLSSSIGMNTTERDLYRMKYNGKWNDYAHLVTHWKPLSDTSNQPKSES